nr:putative phage tail assembly chaperone [uncultured Mediterranean phage uvMED]BAR23663.1 putative phage tail assembly chaperone [uncultured Mediterranean phage uvMED]BAR39160.1 putative phage tail assembly chaperone [uncultured Mediterranean phage uvMED]
MRASELLRNKFGVSQLYKHEVKDGDETVLEIYWHPLTIAERESIQKKTGSDDANDFALGMMVEKALDADGKRLFQDGEKAVLKNAIEANVLQEIQLAMLSSGAENKVEDAKASLKS